MVVPVQVRPSAPNLRNPLTAQGYGYPRIPRKQAPLF